jgi:ATP-dependent DNA helicase RecG|tara:strand:+ start:527 stop:2584 length:2058 start_codon:yes stop_codon:yes gene_type:complete
MSTDQKIEASSLLVSTIKGVGDKLSSTLSKLGIKTIEDLLFHFPIGYQDRTTLRKIAELEPNKDFVVQGVIEKVSQTFIPRKMLLVKIKDNTGHLYLRFFYYFPGLRKVFKEGTLIQVSGSSRLGRFGLETIHPEYEIVKGNEFKPQILAKYPLTKGVSHQKLRKLISEAIELIKQEKIEVTDLLPAHNFSNLNESIINVHSPDPKSNIEEFLVGGTSEARKRIGLEEMVANKISYLSIREQNKKRKTSSFQNDNLATEINAGLAFRLTDDQVSAYEEISADIATQTPMLRLLQGDVGSGKTIVAGLVAAHVVADKRQVAILAPTTILANQHYQNFVEWFGEDEVQLLTSKIPAKEKRLIYEDIADGKTKIIIGTHAVFQEGVAYKNLSLVIYDEQHRFGVSQRLKLKEKAEDYPHQLLLSATPIPRTMAMGVLSGLDISTIKSLPPNRTPIVTTTLPNNRRDALINRIKSAISKDSQVYWVCPLIDESESELIGIEDLEKILKKEFDSQDYEIIHGKMKDKDKHQILQDFKDKKTKILLATTVIEVGIDVPDANIMVIENSERFGLAQLHQLRGRVGRGEKESFCILMHSDSLSELSEKRLEIITETNDGFVIAEEDLKLRGPGDILGLSQTGQPSFTFFDLLANEELQDEAERLAQEVIKLPVEQQRKIVERWFPAHLELSDV